MPRYGLLRFARNDVEPSVTQQLQPVASREPANFLHHLRWRDLYHFRRLPVYQRFSCKAAKACDFLRVTRRPRRLTPRQP